MTYNITKSDGTVHGVPDLTIDLTYTMALRGRDVKNFGAYAAQDTLRLLENFASGTPPRGAIKGQLWYNTTDDSLMQYQGADPSGPSDTSSTSTLDWNPVGANLQNVTSNIIPALDATYNIGSASQRWHKVFANHGTFTVAGDSDAISNPIALAVTGDATLASGTFYPTVNNSTSLGKVGNIWSNVYSQNNTVTGQITLGSAILQADAVGIIPSGTVGLGKSAARFSTIFTTGTDTSLLTVGTAGVASDLIPDSNITHDIGSASNQFNRLYVQDIHEGGSLLSAKYYAKGQDLLVAASPVSATTPLVNFLDNVNDTNAAFGIASEVLSLTSSYRGNTSRSLMNLDLNTGTLTLLNTGVLNAKSISLLNQSSAYDSILSIGVSGGVYLGNSTQPLNFKGNQQTMLYNYGSGDKVVWHSGQMGSGSGLDADLLDGHDSTFFVPVSTYTGAQILSKLAPVDGSGSGLDADTVDGFHLSDLDNRYINVTGDTMTGVLNMGGQAISNLASPASGDQAVPRSYMEFFTSGGFSNMASNGTLILGPRMLMQWGNYGMGGGANNQTVAFNTSFVNVFNIQLTNVENFNNEGNTIRVMSNTLSNFTISNGGGNTFTTYNWFAIGTWN